MENCTNMSRECQLLYNALDTKIENLVKNTVSVVELQGYISGIEKEIVGFKMQIQESANTTNSHTELIKRLTESVECLKQTAYEDKADKEIIKNDLRHIVEAVKEIKEANVKIIEQTYICKGENNLKQKILKIAWNPVTKRVLIGLLLLVVLRFLPQYYDLVKGWF
jgi:hypothetical protein